MEQGAPEQQLLAGVHFKTKTNIAFPGVSPESRHKLHMAIAELGISDVQVVESASYSMAMVVRYALGLSAAGGRVCALIGNSLSGRVAAATLRHLVNAGAEGIVVSVTPRELLDRDVSHEVDILQKMGVNFEFCTSAAKGSITQQIIEKSHNVICGLFEGVAGVAFADELVSLLNDHQTPIHVIEAPLGLDLMTGAKLNPLFASSTLSLGVPLLALSSGSDCVGRHYLCDIAATAAVYKESGSANLTSLFSEQPVLQIEALTQSEPEVS